MQITPEIVTRIKQAAARGFVQHFPKTGNDTCAITAICDAVGLARTYAAVDVVMPPSFKILLSYLNDAPWASNETRGAGLSRLVIVLLNSNAIDEAVFIRRLIDLIVKNHLTAAFRVAANVCPFSDEKQAFEDAAVSCEKRIPNSLSRIGEIIDQAVDTIGKFHENLVNKELASSLYPARKCVEAIQRATNRLSDEPIETSRQTLNGTMYRTWFASWYCIEARAVVDGQLVDNLLAEFAEGVVQILIDLNAPGTRWL